MPVGLEVFGAHGTIQIGMTAPLFCMRSVGTTRTVAKDGAIQFATSMAFIPRPSATAMLAIHPGGPMVVFGVTSDGKWKLYGTAPVDTIIYYWIFDKAPLVPVPASMGLETYSATGELLYAAGMKPMRVVDAATISQSDTRTYTEGRYYGVIQARMANRLLYEPGGNAPNGQPSLDYYSLAFTALAFQGDGHRIHITDYVHGRETGAGVLVGDKDSTREFNISGQILIVDTTNY